MLAVSKINVNKTVIYKNIYYYISLVEQSNTAINRDDGSFTHFDNKIKNKFINFGA